MKYKAIHIQCDDELAETISFLLQEMGYEGTSYENDILIAYCDSNLFDSSALDQLLIPFQLVPKKITDVPLQNWNKLWEKNFKSADLGEHIHSRAPFHPPKLVKHDIIILPKMAFGTGHHETTQLSAIALEKIDCSDKTVLDMGCGSGLLAILASQKGAKHIFAIDYDDNCIQNTLENIQLNKVKNVEVIKDNSLQQIQGKLDIIVSNIVKNINLHLLPEFAEKIKTNGTLILCGFIAEDEAILIQKAHEYGFKLINKNIKKSWLQTQFIKHHVD